MLNSMLLNKNKKGRDRNRNKSKPKTETETTVHGAAAHRHGAGAVHSRLIYAIYDLQKENPRTKSQVTLVLCV